MPSTALLVLVALSVLVLGLGVIGALALSAFAWTCWAWSRVVSPGVPRSDPPGTDLSLIPQTGDVAAVRRCP